MGSKYATMFKNIKTTVQLEKNQQTILRHSLKTFTKNNDLTCHSIHEMNFCIDYILKFMSWLYCNWLTLEYSVSQLQ